MKLVVNMLAIVGLLIGGCASSQDTSARMIEYDFTGVDKVAIVAVEGAIVSEAAKVQIADLFSIELLNKGFAPVGRTQVKAQLLEQEADWESLTTTETAVQAGLVLDVPAVLAIRVPHFGEKISVTAQMINVEDGSTLWLASGSGRGVRSLSNMFGFSRRDEVDDPTLSDVPPGPRPLGGPPNLPLTPEEADKTQIIVKRMCRSLPPKVGLEW